MIPIHRPIFNIDKVLKWKKDEDIFYVCTTELQTPDIIYDIYYSRDRKNYFGLKPLENGRLIICNADVVEDFTFDMIKVDGEYHYSRSHHDCNSVFSKNGKYNMIDGGRQYTRLTANEHSSFKLKCGVFFKVKENTNNTNNTYMTVDFNYLELLPVVVKKLEELTKTFENRVEKKWLSTKELAIYLDYSQDRIHKLKGEEFFENIHYHKRSGKLLFDKDKIDKWVLGLESNTLVKE